MPKEVATVISTPILSMLDSSVECVRMRATILTVAAESSIDGTRVPFAGRTTVLGADAPIYGSLVGSPAWSPPV